MKNSSSGFSLIELLIVVVILAIVAAIAVPGLLASKRSANEGSTISTIRILHSAQMTYSTSFGHGEFAGNVGSGDTAALTTLGSYNLIDGAIATANKSGYNFVGGREASTSSAPAQFYISAVPIAASALTRTGDHRFGVATDGIIRQDATLDAQFANVAATLAAPAIGN